MMRFIVLASYIFLLVLDRQTSPVRATEAQAIADHYENQQERDLFFLELFFPSSNCPPTGFDALNPFDIDSYISALWYPVRSAPVIYARGQSYCSVIQYKRNTSCRFFCGNKPRIEVRNRGRRGAVDGPVNSGGVLRAVVPDPENNPAKIKVSGLQRLTRNTNYWVVAAGTYADALSGEPLQAQPSSTNYDWAIVAGGRPFRETENEKCMPGIGSWDTRGLWMFMRDPIPEDGVIEAVEQLADSMGLDTREWNENANIHEGCTYPTFD